MIRLTREKVRGVKRLSINELDQWLKEFYEDAFDDGRLTGYAEGLTADMDDGEIIVMDEEAARARLTDDEFLRLIGGAD